MSWKESPSGPSPMPSPAMVPVVPVSGAPFHPSKAGKACGGCTKGAGAGCPVWDACSSVNRGEGQEHTGVGAPPNPACASQPPGGWDAGRRGWVGRSWTEFGRDRWPRHHSRPAEPCLLQRPRSRFRPSLAAAASRQGRGDYFPSPRLPSMQTNPTV